MNRIIIAITALALGAGMALSPVLTSNVQAAGKVATSHVQLVDSGKRFKAGKNRFRNNFRRQDERQSRREFRRDRREFRRNNARQGRAFGPRFHVGQSLSRGRGSVVRDFRRFGLRQPARGYRWVRVDRDLLLVAVTTGLIVRAITY